MSIEQSTPPSSAASRVPQFRLPSDARPLLPRYHPDRRLPRGEEAFTLRPRGAGGFETIVGALARKLRDVERRNGRHAVIVEISETRVNHYTQVLIDQKKGAWVEAVANDFILDEAAYLDDEAQALLTDLGFSAPDDFSPNHYRLFDRPVDWRVVARLLIDPLVPVYKASYDTELTVIVRDIRWQSPGQTGGPNPSGCGVRD